MNVKSKKFRFFFAFIAVILFPATNSISAEYEALQGIESANAVFDFRIGDPETALGHLDLVHTMIDDPNMAMNDTQPEIVMVFIGPSVNLISSDVSGFDEDQQGQLEAVADKISAMDKDGIRFEICLTAAHALGVDPDSILPAFNKVENGWISVIGYQHNGYALVADF